jgi:hypothetical protein
LVIFQLGSYSISQGGSWKVIFLLMPNG